MEDARDYILMRVEDAKQKLEKKGYLVKITKNSMPKIKTDSELVVAVRFDGSQAELIVGDFLIEV